MGVCKPDFSIYKMALDYLEVMPQECVFIDDMEDFIESAVRLGIHGIVYKDISRLKENLKSLGILHRPNWSASTLRRSPETKFR